VARLRDLTDPRLRELPDTGAQLVVGKHAIRSGDDLVEQRDHPLRAPRNHRERPTPLHRMK
jgi:hypothetical protein